MDRSEWLACFASDLKRGDIAAAAAGFHETSYWRDLVAFTLLVMVLVFRPQGLLGEALVRRRA